MSVLDVILVILLVSWLGGYGFNIGGNLIHALLVVALVVLVMRLLGVGHVSA